MEHLMALGELKATFGIGQSDDRGIGAFGSSVFVASFPLPHSTRHNLQLTSPISRTLRLIKANQFKEWCASIFTGTQN